MTGACARAVLAVTCAGAGRSLLTRSVLLATAFLLVGCPGGDGVGTAGAQAPSEHAAAVEELLREGKYEEAISALEETVASDPTPSAVRGLAEILLEAGRYERVEELLGEASGAREEGEPALDAAAGVLLGRALVATGRYEEALARFTRVAARENGHALLAELHRGEVLLLMGRREEAFGIFDSFIDVYNQSASLDSPGLQAVAGAVRYLGVSNPSLFRDALRAYDEAVEADAANLGARLGTGELFLDRSNAPDARQAFRQVLERRPAHPDALSGLARVAAFEGSSDAVALVEQALRGNPRLVSARVLRARLNLAAEDLDGAEADLERALAVNPASSEALAVQAGLRFVRGDEPGFEEIAARVLARNPHDARFFQDVAELASRARLYREAVELAGRGVEADSLAWGALASRGLNRLRTGEMEEARIDLERAFEGDPFNVRVKNTLDLLDVMDDFEAWEGPTTRLFLDPEDGEALAIYMLEVSERAYGELAARYGARPEPPIRIEAFRRGADFSVRTVGLTGLGALGVSFGNVLAMESPSARGVEGFHWASVLWHEMAHAFHLSMTDHRVPRWFTEGLAVLEERHAGEGWGARPSVPFLAAYLDDRLRAPSELSRSFVRPRYPEEVQYAYVLGSMVTEWIEEEWGFEALLGILEGFREGRAAADVLDRVLGVHGSDLDERFDDWFRARYEQPLAAVRASARGREMQRPAGAAAGAEGAAAWLTARATAIPNDLEARLELGMLRMAEGDLDAARGHLEAARDLFPENPDPRGPNRLLAALHREAGDEAASRTALERHLRNVGGDYEGWLLAADLREAAGEPEGAARALEAAILVYPFDREVHDRLAQLYEETGDAEREVRERRAALALAPVDRAGALHRLGEAQLRAGRLEAARESALSALELAPRFPEAQDLLLRIIEAGPGDDE